MKSKQKERYEKRCLKLILTKQFVRFDELAKSLKISKSTFYNYGLHKNEKILAAITEVKSTLDGEGWTQNESKKTSKENCLRSYTEIKAKLDLFKVFMATKNNKLTESEKRILDRQILLLEWVLKINKEEA